MKFWYLIFLVTLASTSAFSASFDCNKAKTKIEKTICTDSILSDLDEDLAAVYKEIRGFNPSIVAEQRQWLSSLKSCNDADCLKIKYDERITELFDIKVQAQPQEKKKDTPPVVSDQVVLSGPQKKCYSISKAISQR